MNTEVLPSPTWIEASLRHLERHPAVGACTSRVVPAEPSSSLARWRMVFQEQPYNSWSSSGAIPFATGHAVVVRRAAIEAAGGYDERYHFSEDYELCRSMAETGWSTHYVAGPTLRSVQRESVALLAKKQLRADYWALREGDFVDQQPIRMLALIGAETVQLLVRLARNVKHGRFELLPVDVAVWRQGLSIAWRTRKRLTQKRSAVPASS